MMRILAKEVLLYGISGTISKFIGMFLLPIYTRILTTSDYGIIGMINTICAAVVILSDLQIIHGMGRYFYETKVVNERRNLVGTGYSATVFLAILFGLILFIAPDFWSSFVFHSMKQSFLFKLLGFQIPLSVSFSYIIYLLRLDHKPKKYIIVSLGMSFITISISILLVVYIKLGVMGVILAQVLGFVSGNLIALFFAHKYLKICFHISKIKKMLAFGLPQVPAVAGNWMQQAFGQIMILSLINLSELGIYNLALKVASVLILFQMAFNLAWNPYALSIMNKTGDKEAYSKALRNYIAIGFLLSVPFILFAREIIAILAGPDFYESYKIVGITSAAVIVQGIPMIAGVGIMVTKKTIFNSIAYFVGVLANIAITIYVLRKWGVVGAPLGMLIGRVVHSIVIYRISQYLFPIKHNLKKLFFIILLFGITLLLGLVMNNFALYIKLILMFLITATLISVSIHDEFLKIYNYIFIKCKKG